MQNILHNGKLVAVKISADSMPGGTVPVTAAEQPLGVLTLKHPKGKRILAHRHLPHKRVTETLQECLVVIRGALRVSFYDEEGNAFESIELRANEACVTLSGGHGVEFLEDSEVIEVKNGPFFDDKQQFDKVFG